jgi:hypothetical protein
MKRAKLFSLILGLSFTLGACGGPVQINSFRCPAGVILASTEEWRDIQSPANPDFTINIVDTALTCVMPSPGVIESEMYIGGFLMAQKPNGAPTRDFAVDIFIAVIDRDETVIESRVETVTIDPVDENLVGSKSEFIHEFNPIQFRMADGDRANMYRIATGFRLSTEQLAASREQRSKRILPPRPSN